MTREVDQAYDPDWYYNQPRSADDSAELKANHDADADVAKPPPPGRTLANDFRRPRSIDVNEWRRRRARIAGGARTSNVLPLHGARPRAPRAARAQVSAVRASPAPEPGPPGPPPGIGSLGPAPAVQPRTSVLVDLAEDLVAILVQALEQKPDLAMRLQRVLGVGSARLAAETSRPRFMSVNEYAIHARLSERTIREHVKMEMKEGVHFHRDGRTGRRVIIHEAEADAWRASRSFAPSHEQAVDDLATNEVLRRRAKTALKKAGLR